MRAGRDFRVYISSTFDDMQEDRDAAREVISSYAVVRDSYRASEDGVVESCRQDVREASVYVGILGHRYGWTAHSTEPGAKSITELEYEACVREGKPPIPRLMFLRTTSHDRWRDWPKDKVKAELIEAFRQRAAREQRVFEFKDIAELREQLHVAMHAKQEEHYQSDAPGNALLQHRKKWDSALTQVGLLSVPGTGDATEAELLKVRPELFTRAELDPAAPGLAVQLDQAVRKAQLACVVLTPQSLARLSAAETRDRAARCFELLRRRTGFAPVLCVDFDPKDLPEIWGELKRIKVERDQLARVPQSIAQSIYDELRAFAALSPQTRLAVPYLVLAPTRAEVETLENDPRGFDGFKEPEIIAERQQQFAQLRRAAAATHSEWPGSVYATSRADWRCCGPDSSTISELLAETLQAIDTAPPGSREKELLRDASLVLRPYDLSEYLDDRDGSRRALELVCQRGCLIIVDETALLHPKLRQAANVLLSYRQSAVVSVSACDPMHWPTRTLLGERSFLRVGAMIERFGTSKDTQCELALNSLERLERWLRVAIPRLLSDVEGSGARPELVARMDQRLASL